MNLKSWSAPVESKKYEVSKKAKQKMEIVL